MKYSEHPLDNKLLLGRYRVMRLLGEGGMGTVHLARVEGAEGFTRPVVVKRMRRDIRATEEGNRLFIREAKILSKLQHPGIVGISDFGVEDGAHIMVLEYVHGYTLAPWLEYRQQRDLPLPVDVCLYVVRRILDALHYAHRFDTEEGQEIEIVHRDISPDNVLLSNKGYVHLLDFGIASMRGPAGDGATKSGSFRGKLCYAAPETVKGEPATPRSDQYSAAVLLLELLTGETPFESESVAQTFARMVEETPKPPSAFRDDIPAGLDGVLARALAKDPKERYESALAFSRELRRLQQNDDEDVAETLKELVREEFEILPGEIGVESLKQRELALDKILSTYPGPVTDDSDTSIPQHALPTMVDLGASRMGGRPSPTPAATTVVAAPAPGQKQLHGLLWGLLFVGGLIAVGLGAAVALLSRGPGGEQVVVVGGESASQPDLAHSAPEVNVVPNPSVHPIENDTAEAPADLGNSDDPRGGSERSAETEPRSQSGAVAGGAQQRTTGQALSHAVQQKSSAFQACFAKHLEDTKKSPQAVLNFSVAVSGGAAQVKVEPTSLATTPLGKCLQGAARSVRFPAQEQPVAFRVPVRARVSRAKGTP